MAWMEIECAGLDKENEVLFANAEDNHQRGIMLKKTEEITSYILFQR